MGAELSHSDVNMDEELIAIPSRVPILPLPEAVLFPRSVLPLPISEPRYRQMMADALAAERIVAVALLKPGFEPYYHTLRAPIHRVVGVGQIIAFEQLDDGNYSILLRGVTRARIIAEVPHKPYRLARLHLLDTPNPAPAGELAKLRTDLKETIQSESIGDDDVQAHWLKLLEAPLELGEIADLIACALPVDAELRQCLLAETNPTARTTLLAEQIRTLAAIVRTHRTQSPNAEWKMN